MKCTDRRLLTRRRVVAGIAAAAACARSMLAVAATVERGDVAGAAHSTAPGAARSAAADASGPAPTGPSPFVEVAPGLAIERIIDLALKAVPSVEPGLLFVERQFGILEVHGFSLDDVRRAGDAILAGIGASASDQLRPRVLYHDAIEDIGDQHAVILNRTRQASMVMPGETLLVYEMTPALFATVAANEAERAVPENTLVDVQMIGAAGRVYVSGTVGGVARARAAISRVLDAVEGREH